MVSETWSRPARGTNASLVRVAQRAVVDGLIDLAGDDGATVEARAAAEWGLRRALEAIGDGEGTDATDAAHRALAASEIRRFLERHAPHTDRTAPLDPPPGTPIGSPGGEPPPGRGGP